MTRHNRKAWPGTFDGCWASAGSVATAKTAKTANAAERFDMRADRVCREHSGKHHTTSGKNSFLIIPILYAFLDTDQREYAASLRIS